MSHPDAARPVVPAHPGAPDGPGAPRAADPAALDDLRADLAAAGYTVDGVEDLLGPVAAAALHREEPVPALRVTAPGRGPGTTSGVAALVRLFVLGADVPRAALDGAFARLGVDGAARLGLVEAAGPGRDDAVRAAVDLRPYRAEDAAGPVDWWLASDLGELATSRALRTDHVLGVGGASTTLAQVTVRDPRDRVLDLGTGCGIQALHASRHARAVVGTDISVRALAFARFNAALAGLGPDRVELRRGSMLEPVAGERFSLVVSNPPFVITPRAAGVPAYEYRDGGRAGDAVVRDLVTGLGDVLEPGGVAQLLGNWEVRAGEPWDGRVGRWLDESGLDGWVIQREVQDPAEYAETWIRDGGLTPDRDLGRWRAQYGAWLDDFAARGVEAIGFGVLTLRRPVHGATDPAPSGGGHRDGAPAARGAPRREPRRARLADRPRRRRPRRRPPHRRAGRHRGALPAPGSPDPDVVLLRQGGGLGRTVRAGTALAGLVGACDGELTVGRLAAAIAALFEVPAADVVADVLPSVRGLVRDGLLVPADRLAAPAPEPSGAAAG